MVQDMWLTIQLEFIIFCDVADSFIYYMKVTPSPVTRNTRRDKTTELYSPTTNSMSTVNPTEDTSDSTSNPSALSTILTTQGIDDNTLHQATSTVQRKITDNAANILTTSSIGKN